MPSLEELFAKKKSRLKSSVLETMDLSVRTLPAKTAGNRPLRHWQEGLPQYQTYSEEVEVSTEIASEESSTKIGVMLSGLIRQTADNKALAKSVSKEEESLAETVSNIDKALARTVSKEEEPLAETVSNQPSKNELEEESVSNKTKALARTVSSEEESVSNKTKALEEPLAKFSLKEVRGKERVCLFFVFERCQFNGSMETDIISTEQIREALGIKASHLRNLLWRLKDKKFLTINDVHIGRNSSRKFVLPKVVYQVLRDSDAERKALAKALANPSLSSSSSLKDPLNTTTTEPEKEKFKVSEEWQAVDTSYLDEFGVNGHGIIYQLARVGKLPPHIVQESIKYFAFDLRKNGKAQKIKGDLVAYFVAPLKRGEPYLAPSNYEDPADEKMRLYREGLEKQQKKRAELKEKLKTSILEEWRQKLSEEEKQRISHKKGWEQDTALFSHFENNIWPDKQENVWKQIDEQIGQSCLIINM